MTGRERVQRAMHYQSVDKVPLQYYYTPVGYYEHGDKLNDLYATLPGDFEPFVRMPIQGPAPEEIDENGRYHAVHTDEWGIPWEYRIFGITGIPLKHIIEDDDQAAAYQPPRTPACEGPEMERYCRFVAERKAQGLYTFGGGAGIYERILALYGDENALCGIAMDEPGINTLADRIVEYNMANIQRAIKADVDGISFGDDFGTERAMIMSPDMWRRFIKPRLKVMFEPILKAGKDIFFHSCGQISPILEDMRELGVTAIWPQLPAYNMEELAKYCRELGLAVAIHTDRANTMTYGTPQQVRDLVTREYETFRMWEGGSWFYVEADNGFPFENIQAQIETIAQWR